MWVLLSHLDGRFVVVAVVDATILFGRRNDGLALFGIIHGSSWSGEFSGLGRDGKYGQRAVPIIHRQQVATIFRDGNVARRRSTGVDLSNLGQFAIGADGVGKDLSVVLNVLRAGVDNVELWMKARESRVDDIFRVSFDVQKAHRPV